MTTIAIVDSGPLLAVANAADPDHSRCLEVLRRADLHLVISAPCVAEVAYLLGRRLGAAVEARFVASLAAFEVLAPEGPEWLRVGDLVSRYGSLPLGTVDATVVVLAERFATEWVVTLDRRHFEVVRTAAGAPLRLLPEPGR